MRKYLAEFIGTFVLTFMACGAASFTAGYQGLLGVLGIAIIFGLSVVAMAYSIGNISGCHINPAVSFGMLIAGRMSFMDFMGYVVGQFLGGIAAAFAMLGLTKTFDPNIVSTYSNYGYDLTGLGTNGFGESSGLVDINVYGAIIVEIILTFIFVLVVIGVTSKKEYSSVAGLVIGLTLTFVHLFGIPFTGTSVNPARSFGPALVNMIMNNNDKPMSQVWVFIVAPLVGAAIAAVCYMFLSMEPKKALENDETVENVEEATEEAESKDVE